MFEFLIVFLIIAVAVFYLIRRALRRDAHDCPDCAASQQVIAARKQRRN